MSIVLTCSLGKGPITLTCSLGQSRNQFYGLDLLFRAVKRSIPPL
jgi:hypothetical protein